MRYVKTLLSIPSKGRLSVWDQKSVRNSKFDTWARAEFDGRNFSEIISLLIALGWSSRLEVLCDGPLDFAPHRSWSMVYAPDCSFMLLIFFLIGAADSLSSAMGRSILLLIAPDWWFMLLIAPLCSWSLLIAPSQKSCFWIVVVQLPKKVVAAATKCIFCHFVYLLLETLGKIIALYAIRKNSIVDSFKKQIISLGSKSVRNSKFDTWAQAEFDGRMFLEIPSLLIAPDWASRLQVLFDLLKYKENPNIPTDRKATEKRHLRNYRLFYKFKWFEL